MSDSHTQVVDLAHDMPPQVRTEVPTSPSLARVEPFSPQARQAFHLMLQNSRDQSSARITTSEKHKCIEWLTDPVPERLGPVDSKRRARVRTDFAYERGTLWKLPDRVSKRPREVIVEDLIWDTIVMVHASLGHPEQHATASNVNLEYYGIATSEVHSLVNLCKICHDNAIGKYKGSLRPITATRKLHQIQTYGGRASVFRMVLPSTVSQANSSSFPTKPHPGNANLAQTTSTSDPFPVAKDEDQENDEHNGENAPRQESRRKRRSSKSDTSRSINKSTKRKHVSESSELSSIRSPMTTDEEDADDAPVVPRFRNQLRNSTAAACKASHDIQSTFSSSSDTSGLSLPDDSAAESEKSVQRRESAHDAHHTSLASATSDLDVSSCIGNQPTHSTRGLGLGDSDHSLAQPLPSQPNANSLTQARNDQPGPAVKPAVEIFVVALCGSRITIKRWLGGALKYKKLHTIFHDVAALISRNDIQRINFKLETSKRESRLECLIERDDTAVFEVMIEKFHERIKSCKKAGEARIKILLELDPAVGTEVARNSESDGDSW